MDRLIPRYVFYATEMLLPLDAFCPLLIVHRISPPFS
jgi:hypothetical protein